MENWLKIYTNWRIWVLLILSMPAIVLIFAESDHMGRLIAGKAAGIALACITYRLGKYWAAKGKIKEITDLEEE